MTTETVLTDVQIQWIGSGARLSEYGGALAFARAIEKAVLQSPELQRRMDTYAAAKVSEALEEAAQACEARIGTHAPGMTPEDVEDCDEEARLCAGAVRSLIPKE